MASFSTQNPDVVVSCDDFHIGRLSIPIQPLYDPNAGPHLLLLHDGADTGQKLVRLFYMVDRRVGDLFRLWLQE